MNDDQWSNAVQENVTIARAEIARGEVLNGETVVNQILERFRIAKDSRLSTVDEEDSKEKILADLTEAMRSTRSGEMFPIPVPGGFLLGQRLCQRQRLVVGNGLCG